MRFTRSCSSWTPTATRSTPATPPVPAVCWRPVGRWWCATPRSSSGCATAWPPTPPSQGVQVGIDPGSKHTGLAVFTDHGGSRTGLYSDSARPSGRADPRQAHRPGRVAPGPPVAEPALPRPPVPQPHQTERVARAVAATPRRHHPVAGGAADPVGARDRRPRGEGLLRHPRPVGRAGRSKEWSTSRAPSPGTRSANTCWPNGGAPAPTAARAACRSTSTTSTPAAGAARTGSATSPWPASAVTRPRTPPRCRSSSRTSPHSWRRSSSRRRLRCATPPPSTPPAGHCGRRWKRHRPARAAASGGRTKWNRSRTGAPKSHTLDALHVGALDTVTAWPSTVLVVKATGRGTYCPYPHRPLRLPPAATAPDQARQGVRHRRPGPRDRPDRQEDRSPRRTGRGPHHRQLQHHHPARHRAGHRPPPRPPAPTSRRLRLHHPSGSAAPCRVSSPA